MSRDPFPADRRDAPEGGERRSVRQPSLVPDALLKTPPPIPVPCETVDEREQHSPDEGRSYSVRFYHARGRAYRLSDSERQTLEEVGKFRVIAVRDLERYAYQGDHKQLETEIRRLRRQGLLCDERVVSQRKTIRILTLTKAAHRLLNNARLLPEDQAVYHGLRKPREVQHDTDLYRLYQNERARIARDGGRPLRIRLDYELRKNLNRDLASVGKDAPNEQRKQELAQKHGLEVVDGKIPIPDLRIEYESAEGEVHHIDLELATREYRPRSLAAKAAAGFSLYSRAEDAPRLRRILAERELPAGIHAL